MKNYKAISTKVSPWVFVQLTKIAAKTNRTIYDYLQLFCDVVIRYMSDRTNLSDDINAIIQTFVDDLESKAAFNFCDLEGAIVDKAIYFLGNEKKQGLRAVMVHRPEFGEAKMDVNVERILEMIFCCISNRLYLRLRRIGAEMECQNMVETLDMLCRLHETEDVFAEIRKDFEDADRHDYGNKPSDNRYKRKMHRTPDSVAAQEQTIRFEPEDVPELPETSTLSEPYRPFDQEY